MNDPADIEEQRKVEAVIDAASIAFEIAVLSIIAERLGTLESLSITEAYARMPEDLARIRQAVADGIKNLQSTTKSVMDKMAKANDEWAAKYYKARNKQQVAAFNHSLLGQTLQQYTDSATKNISAFCRSSVVRIGNKGSAYVPIAEAYRRLVTSTATAMTAGNTTGQQAIKEAVTALSNSGLRVMYQSGATRNLQTAIRTNVMDAYRTAMSSMREIQGEEFEADGVEVSAHALCAKDHQEYQGNQYSYERRRGYRIWREVQFEPARPLVSGANCHHTVFPVILGVSRKAYTDKELQQLKDRSNENVSFTGLSGETLTMSRYDASQYQRKIETAIRYQKEQAYLLKQSGQSASTPTSAARSLTAKYKDMSAQMGLTPRLENTRIYVPK